MMMPGPKGIGRRSTQRALLLALDPKGWGEATFAVHLAHDLRHAGYDVSLLLRNETHPLVLGSGLCARTLPDDTDGAASAIIEREIKEARPDVLVLCDIVTTERALSAAGANPLQVLASGLPVIGVDTWDGALTGTNVDLFGQRSLEVAAWLKEVPHRLRPVPFLDPARPGACRFMPDRPPVPAQVRRDLRRTWAVVDNQKVVLFCTAAWQHTAYPGDGGRLARQVPLLLAQYTASLGDAVHFVHVGPQPYPLEPILRTRYHWHPQLPPAGFDAALAAADLILSANITAATTLRAALAQIPVVVVQQSITAASVEEVAHQLGLPLLPAVESWLRATVPIYPFAAWPLGYHRYLEPVLDQNPYVGAIRRVELCDGSEVYDTMARLLFDAPAQDRLRHQQTRYVESVQLLPLPSQRVRELLGRR